MPLVEVLRSEESFLFESDNKLLAESAYLRLTTKAAGRRFYVETPKAVWIENA
jgi:hypothetical protein